jgi:hypothetical protein
VDEPPPRRSFARAGWLFRRLLGVVYFIAFWSLARQVIGLVGHDGILPAQSLMEQVRHWSLAQHIGLDRYRLFPTLCWISASDAFLRGLCFCGMALAAGLVAGVAPLFVLPLLWLTYLSMSVVAQDFLLYQWDTLLLETGFLAIFLAPVVWFDRRSRVVDIPRLGRWLMIWLLFRLMVGSGAIKLASGDPMWRSLTALTVHYETQPIPTPVAWYAHQLPVWFQKASTAAVIGVELFVPFLIIGPRRARHAACALLLGLQAMIALTGNYAFFNLLAAALCVLLLEDPPRMRQPAADGRGRRAVLIAVAILTLPVSLLAFGRSLGIEFSGLRALAPVAELTFPFHSVNTYGLFAVMTTTRPEIIVEGSDDGVVWKAYEFDDKAGDVNRRPPWVAPHQPRLDWQMWFAALGDYRSESWFQRFCVKLLEGSPAVLGLLAHNPFPEHAPRYVRAELYRYRFASSRPPDGGSGADRPGEVLSGRWWTGERLGSYSPVLSLSGSR